MLIYSIMPFYQISESKSEQPTIIQKVNNHFIELDAKNKIVRVISTDLKDYMRYELGNEFKAEESAK